MPLLDHFHPPLRLERQWEGFHHLWATTIVQQLNDGLLPDRYFAEPSIRLGGLVEIDVATLDRGEGRHEANAGGVAVATWAPPRATGTILADFTDPDLFEILIYNDVGGPRVVAAIELVSPSNKDWPGSRRMFAVKCAAYLQAGVRLVTVDVVTDRSADLHAELVRLLGAPDDPAGVPESGLYAVAYRAVPAKETPLIEFWHRPLALGAPLPTMPLWIAPDLCLPLDLERAYAAARASSRIH